MTTDPRRVLPSLSTTPYEDHWSKNESELNVELKLSVAGPPTPDRETLEVIAFIAQRSLVQALCKCYPAIEVEDIIAAIDARMDYVRQAEIDDKSNRADSVRKRIAIMSDADVVLMWKEFAK